MSLIIHGIEPIDYRLQRRFSTVIILFYSGDIRDQNLTLSENVLNFGRFLAPDFKGEGLQILGQFWYIVLKLHQFSIICQSDVMRDLRYCAMKKTRNEHQQ